MSATSILRKWFILLGAVTIFMLLVNINQEPSPTVESTTTYLEIVEREKLRNWRNLTAEDISKMSKLGRILFLQEVPPEVTLNKSQVHKILIWKYWKYIEKRHMKQYGDSTVDPFDGCSVKNCEIHDKDSDLEDADLVIFHMQRLVTSDIPGRHKNGQIWAFLTDESPYNTFVKKTSIDMFNGVFNWSMTYRMDADIPVPYGRTLVRTRKNPNTPMDYGKNRKVLVTVLASNCGSNNRRWAYVKELQNYMKVDFYGKCGTLKTCPGHFTRDCTDIDNYMFYLAFENGNCREYLTEKVWWNAFAKNAIPIVMGASKDSYAKLLPPGSYLNVENFAKPKDLANYILYLNKTEKFRDFYKWKRDFEVRNEHGYFQSKSFHLCRACEALNYNSREEKVYNYLGQFWSVDKNCYPAWDP